jgi:hypothetical protein
VLREPDRAQAQPSVFQPLCLADPERLVRVVAERLWRTTPHPAAASTLDRSVRGGSVADRPGREHRPTGTDAANRRSSCCLVVIGAASATGKWGRRWALGVVPNHVVHPDLLGKLAVSKTPATMRNRMKLHANAPLGPKGRRSWSGECSRRRSRSRRRLRPRVCARGPPASGCAATAKKARRACSIAPRLRGGAPIAPPSRWSRRSPPCGGCG